MAKDYIWVDQGGREYQVSGPASASFEAGYTDKRIKEHRRAEVLDHIDGSVTEEKLANGAVTDKKIGERTIHKPDGDGVTTGTLTGLLNTIVDAAKTHASEVAAALRGKVDKKTANGGFAGGEETSAGTGGAVGKGAATSSGFAGGEGARAAVIISSIPAFGPGEEEETVSGIDAIQLGTGTNSTEKTLQIYDHQLLDAVGHIPVERLQNEKGGFAAGAEAKTVDYNGKPLDAIQLGTGTNGATKTLKVYDFQLMNSSGKIPEDRLPRKRTAIIVGTKTEGHTLDVCDFLCTGSSSSDYSYIAQAINKASSTGINKVFLLPGTYKLNIPLSFGGGGDFTFCGSGDKTILERHFSTSGQGVIHLDNLRHHVTIENLCIDGRKEAYTSGANHGILVQNGAGGSATIRNCEIYNNTDYGIRSVSYNYGKTGVTIESNYIHDNKNGLLGGDINTRNVLENNTVYGICTGKYFSWNTCKGSQYGIYTYGSSATIIGNKLIDNEIGICAKGKNAILCGNFICRGSGTAADYTTAQKTIELTSESKNNVVTGNQCCGKDVTAAGEGNIVTDNNI